MSIARVTEISAASTTGFDDAVRQGLERAAKSLRMIQSAWVNEQKVVLDDGKIKEWRVNLQVTFVLDD